MSHLPTPERRLVQELKVIINRVLIFLPIFFACFYIVSHKFLHRIFEEYRILSLALALPPWFLIITNPFHALTTIFGTTSFPPTSFTIPLS